MDISKLSIGYLNTLKLYSTREVRRFNQWKKCNEQRSFEIRDLFIKLENLKPKKVEIKEVPIEINNTLFTIEEQDEIIDTVLNNMVDKEEFKVHPCATMIKEAFVRG